LPEPGHVRDFPSHHIRITWPGGDLGHQKKYHAGTATSRGWSCTIDDNPIGFCLIVCCRAVIVGVAIAEVMYGVGLCADPIKTIQHALPFLPTRAL
jgi:hypothetical protein